MAKVSTTISLDSEVKAQSQALLAEMGLDLSTAVGVFLRQMIRERRFPCEIALDTPNAVTLAAMEQARRGEEVYGPFHSVEDLMESLNAED